jgi:hypothetical protein
MMVENIKNSDYTIIMLTDNYVAKADSFTGGVGTETSMLFSYVHDRPNKIIPINTKWNTKKTVPLYLTGMHYIDFTNETDFHDKFKELIHRILKVDIVEEHPIGITPELKPRKIEINPSEDVSKLIPSFKTITDLDKNKFMRESFNNIKSGLVALLEKTKQSNENFEYEVENISNNKAVFKLYLEGNQKHAVKMWLGNGFGSSINTINLSYGRIHYDNDNSMNEIIQCEIGENKELKLKMTMNMFGNREAISDKDVTKEIWRNMVNYLQ